MLHAALTASELTATDLNKLKKHPISATNGNILQFQSNVRTIGVATNMVTLGALAKSSLNEKLEQFPADQRRVKSILLNNDNALVRYGLLINDIEIGVLAHDYESSQELESLPFTIVSGRHRLIALLTWCKYSGYSEGEYETIKLRVIINVVNEFSELTDLIIAANGSRNMTRSEVVNMKLTAVCENSIESICMNFRQGNVTLGQALGHCLHIIQAEETLFVKNKRPLTSDVLATITKRVVTFLKTHKSFQTPEKLLEIVLLLQQEIPAALDGTRLGKKESLSTHAVVARIANKLCDNIAGKV